MKYNSFQSKYIRTTKTFGAGIILILLTVVSGAFLNACQQDEEVVISKGEPVSLSLSGTELVLSQKAYASTALTINWTRGTNQGTGSSISYVLEIDKAGNNFANAKIYDLGKGVYAKSFSVSSLNDLILNYWGVQPGVSTEFEAKVTANVTDENVEDGATEIKTFSATPYKPVSSGLYIVGGATPNGWDISNATALTASASKPWVFTYAGHLSTNEGGTFKFAVSQDACWCQDFYTKDPADDEMMVYNEGSSGDDIQWNVVEGGNYKVTVNLLDLTISIEKLEGPAYSELYVVGSATPVNDWVMPSDQAFVQNADDPFIFTYEATLTPGEFKIATFSGNWCDGEWLNASQPDQALTATDYIVTQGCDGPDNKWVVTEETQGRYKITVDLQNATISIEPVMLYLIGDATPNGWEINNPEPMTYANGVYTFNGALSAGEFKFSKYKGDWCDGDWLISASPNQSVTNGSYTVRHGCEGDDNKWKLQDGDAGNYTITVDLDNQQMTIVKQ